MGRIEEVNPWQSLRMSDGSISERFAQVFSVFPISQHSGEAGRPIQRRGDVFGGEDAAGSIVRRGRRREHCEDGEAEASAARRPAGAL